MAASPSAAPLPGLCSKELVEASQQVTENVLLSCIEAMKMETTVTAPQDLTVGCLALAEGADDLVLMVA